MWFATIFELRVAFVLFKEHQDDIQCMSFNAPHTLASASYDGELVLWNTNSEQAFRHLGCKARKTTRTNRRLKKLVSSYVFSKEC